MRSAEEFDYVRRLVAAGFNDCTIARITGIPRRTVRDLRCRPSIRPRTGPQSKDCSIEHDFSSLPAVLDALEIPWTRSTNYIVSIYRKAATARMDEFVGPKDIAVPLNGVHYTA